MVKNYLAAFVALLCLSISTSAQVTVEDSFLVDGIYRSYRLYIPGSATQVERPLVLNMHGLGSNALEQQYYSNFMPIADTAGFFVVMPQGTSYGGSTFWNVGFPGTPPVDDIKFLSALIDSLSLQYPVDKARVYATGMSNGGYMAHLMGMELNNKVAAIASVTGSIVPQRFGGTLPGRAVPAMQVHGTADMTVPYEGFIYGMPIDSVVNFWVRHNGCSPAPARTAVANTSATDGSTAEHFVWSGGRNGASVELFKVAGGGHTWPGAPFNIGVTNQDFSASREIWRFFSQYRLDQFTAVDASPAASPFGLRISPNPAGDLLHISAPYPGTATIIDASGRRMAASSGKSVDISALPPGVYLLRYSGEKGDATVKFVKERP